MKETKPQEIRSSSPVPQIKKERSETFLDSLAQKRQIETAEQLQKKVSILHILGSSKRAI
jgi:hypothetical protein